MTLYEKFIELLLSVNDESVSEKEHRERKLFFDGWKKGVRDAADRHFNGDYYYLDLGIDRLMCCGEFLDWKSSYREGEDSQRQNFKTK